MTTEVATPRTDGIPPALDDTDLASHLVVAMVEAGNPSQYPAIGEHAKAIVQALRRQQGARLESVRSEVPQVIADAMADVSDRTVPIEDRAALYAVLQQVQLRINRALRLAKDDLIVHLESNGLRDFGPLSIKATAIDVAWPANAPENHADATIQDAMETYARIAPDYFSHIPDHWELATAALGKGVAEGDPVARELHAECKRRGWRTEQGRRLSLAVKEVKS